MGDMADMALDEVIDNMDRAIDQQFDPGFEEFEDPTNHRLSVVSVDGVVCRCCGEGGLTWQKVNGKWLLHEKSGEFHNCKVNPYKERSKK